MVKNLRIVGNKVLPVAGLDVDTSLVASVRAADPFRIKALAEAYADRPEDVPPIVLLSDGYTVVDGLHRVEALRKFRSFFPDRQPPTQIEARILDISPDDPTKWLAIVEFNSPSLVKPLTSDEALKCIRGYLSSCGEVSDEQVRSLRSWARKMGIASAAIDEVLSVLGYESAITSRPHRKREAASTHSPAKAVSTESTSRKEAKAEKPPIPQPIPQQAVAASPSSSAEVSISLVASLLLSLAENIEKLVEIAEDQAQDLFLAELKAKGEVTRVLSAARVVKNFLDSLTEGGE